MSDRHDDPIGSTADPQPAGSAADPPDSYQVGYRRPPLATRFQPGRSGNPKGRPRGARNLSTIAVEKLGEKIKVRERGRERHMSKGEIGVTKLVNRFAETGDPKIFEMLQRLQHGGAGGAETALPEAATHENDTAILNWFLDQHRPEEKSDE